MTMRLLRVMSGALLFGLLFASAGAASATSGLSPAQSSAIARQIAKLKFREERALAGEWSDAKKVAEFICRPLALATLKRHLSQADRVFLGNNDPATLRLISNRRLEGTGQVRTGSSWHAFTFVCALDPLTGKGVSFDAKL
ncbi:hypothetical protein [Bradyrhizobium sp. LHD-71]|uniref:hypothetical protein n=1 Tax=Bradyrhizobium sp. LHD-71 TaxID=3072141 RepID=UPI00280CB373|nr:hypothetical protein [Bradyrhizobium sp. LHD-71]MDQ8729183.1 hypothetical protein [Bradyrhizobium sp. LHD-71]